MVDRAADQLRPWRPRLRLSVRVLMILVLLLGGGLGWVEHRARIQREAVAAIKRAGGSVGYDDAFLGESAQCPAAAPGWKVWLVDHVGIDYVETATDVHLSGDGGVTLDGDGPPTEKVVDDATMAEVRKLRGLTSLVMLEPNGVTDAGLANLNGLSRLRTLSLGGRKIHGAGLANLAG